MEKENPHNRSEYIHVFEVTKKHLKVTYYYINGGNLLMTRINTLKLAKL